MAAVDQGSLRKLMEDLGNDPDVMLELIETFLGEAPRTMREMRDALEQGDQRTLNRCAHSMKSTAATFGARELSRMCRELEDLSAREMPPDARERVAAAEDEWARVKAEIMAWKP